MGYNVITAEVCGPRLLNMIQGRAFLKCIRLSAHYRSIKFEPDVAARVAATAWVELDCCSTVISEIWPIIEVMLQLPSCWQDIV
jgi:hypothetical protein